MKTFKTLKKDFSTAKPINLLFNGRVTKDKVQATIYKMLYSFEYNDFFNFQDKYNFIVEVVELNSEFLITIKTDDDYLMAYLRLMDLEVVPVS